MSSVETPAAGDPAGATQNKRQPETNEGGGEEETRKGWKRLKTEKSKRGFGKKGKGKWVKDFGDDGKDKRDEPPHIGSFANPAMREKFGITLDKATPSGDGNETEPVPTSKKKVVLFLGFLGTRYGGFQANPDQRTLQAEIELALYKCGMISDTNFGTPHKYSWSNSARTDKGVHACAQVCSLKVELPVSDWEHKPESPTGDPLGGPMARLQALLPEDIRVLDMVRSTRNFCAKTQRDRVRYQYMVPSFLLHPDWRGLMEDHGIDTAEKRRNADNVRAPLTTTEAEALYAVLKDYRSTEENRGLLSAALQKCEGTRSFHNFTKGLKPGQAQAKRFIETFRAQDPVVVDGIEWIPTQVLGQSFLLHQIRKMICVAIDVARGAAPLSFMDRALDPTETVALHVAPAQGLFLEMSYFGGYNRRKNTQTNHDLPDIDWTRDGPARDRWLAFRNVVRDHICQEDKNQLNFVQFLFLHECVYGCREAYGLGGKKDEENVHKEEGAAQEKDEGTPEVETKE
ncbi:unnamed protein product [Pseudo-nitzschia multistriata]|uniref:Pseudouridine synthase I TruA alpha/beta domain-containing protein n=1 Tax=Pseudo-nitzschia multistriata TaxID=183589 RepID=A0A448YUA0_9STRA|nr:unnamed protein product [Pseudo-nitzschia multistriata]